MQNHGPQSPETRPFLVGETCFFLPGIKLHQRADAGTDSDDNHLPKRGAVFQGRCPDRHLPRGKGGGASATPSGPRGVCSHCSMQLLNTGLNDFLK